MQFISDITPFISIFCFFASTILMLASFFHQVYQRPLTQISAVLMFCFSLYAGYATPIDGIIYLNAFAVIADAIIMVLTIKFLVSKIPAKVLPGESFIAPQPLPQPGNNRGLHRFFTRKNNVPELTREALENKGGVVTHQHSATVEV